MASRRGIPNLRVFHLHEKVKELGMDPFEALIHFAKGDWKALGYAEGTVKIWTKNGPAEVDTISPQQRLAAIMEACSYLYPKRAAIQHTVEDEREKKGALIVDLTWADQTVPEITQENPSTEEDKRIS